MPKDDDGSAQNRRTLSADRQSDELGNRLERLRSQLEKTDTSQSAGANHAQDGSSSTASGVGQAFRLSSEFIAGVVVGAGIGYLVDKFFNTSPWGLIVFLLLGFAAAVLNVMRAAGMIAESQMRLKPAKELGERQQNDESDPHAQK